MRRIVCLSWRALVMGGVSALVMGASLGFTAARAGTYTLVHTFTGGADGAEPYGRLRPDTAGNLYGTASLGGKICSSNTSFGCGVVYKIDPAGALTTLHMFDGDVQGFFPAFGVTLLGHKLVGSASGGASNAGILYSMAADGTAFTVTHQFTGEDGSLPQDLLAAADGGFYGTTANGGPAYQNGKKGNGVLFLSDPNGKFTVLHNFTGGQDGRQPFGLVMDGSGNVFGSTNAGGGGATCGCGTVFEFNPHTGAFTTVYSFQGETDGRQPALGGVDASGTLYGSAYGGTAHHGTLFSLTPQGSGYGFTLLATLKSNVEGDVPEGPPTLVGGGALVQATDVYLFGYHAGTVVKLATFGPTSPEVPIYTVGGQLLAGAGAVLHGTAIQGGIVPCIFSNGQSDGNGCGTVFSYTLR